jgi:hypothetical protein
MLENLQTHLRQWSKTTEPRIRLQQTYLAAALGIIVAAGIISLLDAPTGHAIARFAGGALMVFIVNAIVWALSQSVITSYVTGRRTTKK